MDAKTAGEASSSAVQSDSSSISLEDCLKLLRGERDEQRLAGLLLVTKVCSQDDRSAIRQVYHAVGPKFLHRLLRTGMGKGGGKAEHRDTYLQLAVTVLSAICRVPEIAASEDMRANIPLILEIVSKVPDISIIGDCYEFLFLVSSVHEDGIGDLYKYGGMQQLATQVSTLPDGSPMVEISMKLVQLMINKLPADEVYIRHRSELATVVVAAARQFSLLHTALKFEALHILSTILSSQYSAPVHEALRSMENHDWKTSMRSGIVAILNNRVAPSEKFQALALAECIISSIGEDWLVGPVNLPEVQEPIPADRCILLVLESSRVEIAVLLNELAYFRDAASKSSSPNADTIPLKQRNLGIAYSLVEKVIKLVTKFGEDEKLQLDAGISESTLSKILSGLNETIGVVLEYLEDAKEHDQNKGDDLLASVRLIGSYLAEAPVACGDKVKELLSYMVSVQGEDEPSSFLSICFLLPMLCQITMEINGCRLLAASGAYKAVNECLVSLIGRSSNKVEDSGCIFLACDTVLNFLLKKEQIEFGAGDATFVKLLGALSHWGNNAGDPGILMMAASICSLILDLTSSEEALLCHPEFSKDDLIILSKLIRKSLGVCGREMMSVTVKEEADLHQIITSSYPRWMDRFPIMKNVIEK